MDPLDANLRGVARFLGRLQLHTPRYRIGMVDGRHCVMQALAFVRRQPIQQLSIGRHRFKQGRCRAQGFQQRGVRVICRAWWGRRDRQKGRPYVNRPSHDACHASTARRDQAQSGMRILPVFRSAGLRSPGNTRENLSSEPTMDVGEAVQREQAGAHNHDCRLMRAFLCLKCHQGFERIILRLRLEPWRRGK